VLEVNSKWNRDDDDDDDDDDEVSKVSNLSIKV